MELPWGAWLVQWCCGCAGSLLPGSLVNARVRNILSDGLLVSFLTYFNGTIDSFHLAQVRHSCSPACMRSQYPHLGI